MQTAKINLVATKPEVVLTLVPYAKLTCFNADGRVFGTQQRKYSHLMMFLLPIIFIFNMTITQPEVFLYTGPPFFISGYFSPWHDTVDTHGHTIYPSSQAKLKMRVQPLEVR
jgi:hypothetical protein